MTQQPASSPERTLVRILSIAGRTTAATPDPWGYVRPSGVICAPDTSDVAHCLHGPDAVFIAHARSDLPWLLDQLQTAQAAHRVVQAQLQRRLDWLRAAIQANEELNKLPWQGDGLHGFVAEGLDPEQAQWICQVIEEVASVWTPRPSASRTRTRERRGDVGWAAGCQRASAARPCQATPPSGEGVVAPLT
jgi:hypothetical protein